MKAGYDKQSDVQKKAVRLDFPIIEKFEAVCKEPRYISELIHSMFRIDGKWYLHHP
jgi:hypothetical protein